MSNQERTGEDTREEVYKFIADYLRKNNMTISEFTHDLNANISHGDFMAFFKKLGMKTEQRGLEALFEGLDPKNTGRVSKNQFIETISPFVNQKPAQHRFNNFMSLMPVMTAGIEKSLSTIAAHVQEKRMTPQQYFNMIDSDNSGFLERKELRRELLNMGMQFSDIEMDNLLDFFDNSRDGRINSKEFVAQIERYTKQVKSPSSPHSAGADLSDSPVPLTSGFSNKSPSRFSNKSPSRYSSISPSRLSSAEDIFSRINKVIKESGISYKEAFKIFDKNGDGKISLQELK